MKRPQELLAPTEQSLRLSRAGSPSSRVRAPYYRGRVLLVGNPGSTHVGAHLAKAAEGLELPVMVCDSRRAFKGPAWWRRATWWLGGRRPPKLRGFSLQVVETCFSGQPRALLCTGIAPLERRAIERIKGEGIVCINYLTDDPWNRAHRARWFLAALPSYDHIFSPRKANLEDLRCLGCRNVFYLPFAYAPEDHFVEAAVAEKERRQFEADVVFAGGGDVDRVRYISALIRAGFRLALYGGYWERRPETRSLARGLAEPPVLRKAIGGAKVSLCLVRKANRDGHSMRSFEVPAMGGCMLAEDTEEHRELLGPDGECAVYFRGVNQMLERLSWLLENQDERERIAEAARRRITERRNTYQDRLATMLKVALS